MATRLTVEEIIEAIAAANKARYKARRECDVVALAGAIRHYLKAKRRAGKALLDARSGLAGILKEKTAGECRALARLSGEQFAAKIDVVTRRAVAAVQAPCAGEPRTRMALTPWKREADGSLSRTLTAVDDEGAKANGPQLEKT